MILSFVERHIYIHIRHICVSLQQLNFTGVKTMKKWISVLTVLMLVASIFLVACGSSDTKEPASETPSTGSQTETPATETPATETPAAEFKVGMVTDVGGVNDNSFNQSAWEGLQQFKADTGAVVDYLQSKGDEDYLPNINDFTRQGFDLTWGIGFLMEDAIRTVAEQNPDAKFGIIDGVVDGLDNVSSVTFAEQEGSFLVGVVAGLTTKTNKIGFVGGMQIPVIERFHAGFVAGVEAVNPDAEVFINYTGFFDKPDEGKAAAAAMYDKGADVVFHAAGQTGNGVFGEANDRKKAGQDVWVIGVDRDQSDLGEEITLTSMVKRVDVAVQTVSQALLDGNFPAGHVVLGIKDSGVGLPENNPHVSQEILDKVAEFQTKIVNGEITVPEVPAQ